MRKGVRLPFLVAAVLFLATSPGQRLGAQDVPRIAILSFYEGSVDVIRSGLPLGLYPSLPLYNGDVIQTRRGRATMSFEDGSEVKIRPNTRLTVSEDARRRDIEVVLGRLWAWVRSSKDRETSFKTGSTVAAVRGTRLEYAALRDGSVTVGLSEESKESLIDFLSRLPDGTLAKLVLHPGTQSSAALGGAPGPLQAFLEGSVAGPDTLEGAGDGAGEGGEDTKDTIVLRAPQDTLVKQIDPDDPPQKVRFEGWVRCPGESVSARMRRRIRTCESGDMTIIELVRSYAGTPLAYYGCEPIAPADLDARLNSSNTLTVEDCYVKEDVELAFQAERAACAAAWLKNR